VRCAARAALLLLCNGRPKPQDLLPLLYQRCLALSCCCARLAAAAQQQVPLWPEPCKPHPPPYLPSLVLPFPQCAQQCPAHYPQPWRAPERHRALLALRCIFSAQAVTRRLVIAGAHRECHAAPCVPGCGGPRLQLGYALGVHLMPWAMQQSAALAPRGCVRSAQHATGPG